MLVSGHSAMFQLPSDTNFSSSIWVRPAGRAVRTRAHIHTHTHTHTHTPTHTHTHTIRDVSTYQNRQKMLTLVQVLHSLDTLTLLLSITPFLSSSSFLSLFYPLSLSLHLPQGVLSGMRAFTARTFSLSFSLSHTHTVTGRSVDRCTILNNICWPQEQLKRIILSSVG